MLDPKSSLIPHRSDAELKVAALAALGDQGSNDKLATDCRPRQNLVKKFFTVGTWNIRTLFAQGKLEKLQIEMNNYDYNNRGLAEMRWTGVGQTRLENRDKIWWSGEPKTYERGV